MKRLHVHVAVDDLAASIKFYSAPFAAEPTVTKVDYAKWMLDDPCVNFAISARGAAPGQLVGDFLEGRPSTQLGSVEPPYKPGVRLTDLATALPDYASRRSARRCRRSISRLRDSQ